MAQRRTLPYRRGSTIRTVGIDDQVNVVVTTESSTVLEEMHEHERRASEQRSRNVPNLPTMNFVTNPYENVNSTLGASVDDPILVVLSTLRLQLTSDIVVGNCCSNFHVLLSDLVKAGCGKSTNFQCLQDHPDPQYRLCCSWDKSDICVARRQATQ
jgi:hypothetical protein